MSDYQPSDIRVSDAEREEALAKLGEHMSAGRLDIDEYGERSAEVATAKTRGQLLGLFGDLPEPKPAFGRPKGAVAPRQRGFAEKVAPVAIPVAAILAVGVVLVVLKIGFFLPVLFFFLFVNGRWHGQDRRRDQRRWMRHERGY
ncbi:DUF1707 SHOCT-like domain-containing protein [Actinophytocola glycyrrhizae]|uniref:DUF1707 domain-containing protein n=1 Tax=Actinophytocola glycyrrhizae TaxID=2044873 RepID=A0ABV9RYE2_9PSEU